MSENIPEYDVVEIEEATVLSVIPYTDGAEYHEYTVDGEELPELLGLLEQPDHAEKVVDVQVTR